MIEFFRQILYIPLLNALVLLYNNLTFQDLGIAIITLTILIRVVLLPLFYKSAKDQAILQRLAPKLKEIQKKHKEREKAALEMISLYREHRVNPFSPFILLLIQLPVLIALYFLFLQGLTEEALKHLYPFVSSPNGVNTLFLGFIDLSKRNILLILLTGLAQYVQSRLSMPQKTSEKKSDNPLENMGRQMVIISPILIVAVLYFANLPAAVALYWLTTSVFSAIQQVVINKRLKAQATNN